MIVVDVETTGFDPKKHSIVSIGAIDFNNPKRIFYIENKIWNGAEVFTGNKLLGDKYKPALEINGFTKEQITDENKPSLKEAIEKFLKWIEECEEKVVAGNNPYFDLDFLRQSALMFDMEWPLSYHAIDLHTLTFIHYKQRELTPGKLRGNDCFIYVGLPIESIPHNALTGAKLEAEAFSRLIYGKNLLEEFKEYPIPEYLNK